MGSRSKQKVFQRRYTDSQQVHENVLNIMNHQGNVNNKELFTPHLLEWMLFKKKSVGKDEEKRESFVLMFGV